MSLSHERVTTHFTPLSGDLFLWNCVYVKEPINLLMLFCCDSFGATVIELVCLTFEILARMDTVYVVGSARQTGSKVNMGDDENSEGNACVIIC